MKKILVFVLLLFMYFNSVKAEEEPVFLQLDTTKNFKSAAPDYNSKAEIRVLPQAKQDNLEKILFYNEDDRFKSKTFSRSAEKHLGRTTFGTTFSNDVKPENMTNSLTFFSKYQREKFSLNSAYKQSQNFTGGRPTPGVFSITPEYRLNDYFTLQNIYSSNFSNDQRKNEVVLSVYPMKNERVNFSLGAGQIYYNDNRPGSSQFNFSTGIKF